MSRAQRWLGTSGPWAAGSRWASSSTTWKHAWSFRRSKIGAAEPLCMIDPARLQRDWTIRPFRTGAAPAARRLIESVWHENFHHPPDPFVRDFIHSRLSDVDDA